MTSFKTQIFEKLTDPDKGSPIDFLSRDSDCIETYHGILYKIWFIEETNHFCANGIANRQNNSI